MATDIKTLLADRDKAAEALARGYYATEPSLQIVVRLLCDGDRETRDDEPIKFLLVNPDTPAVGIQPLYFTPDAEHGVRFSSIVVEVTPDEHEGLKNGALSLPKSWKLGRDYPRPARA